jgi:Fic family protein
MSQKLFLRHIIQAMPKKIPEQELEAIAAIVSDYADGVKISEIRDRLEFSLPPRMLQRRLNHLAKQDRIFIKGTGKGTRYFPKIIVGQSVFPGIEARAKESYVPVSQEGKSIKKAIRLPVQERQPVGYRREFLDAYRPNETFYLPDDTRQQLLEKGQSNIEMRPAGTYVRQIFNRLLIDLSWNSSRLEGNTYSLLETERLLELGESAEGKNTQEAQMILNHKAAIELLVEQADEIGFNRYTILNLHALLSDNLLPDPQACGRLRNKTVEISGTVYHPLDVPQQIEDCFQQILDTATAIRDPFEQAFFVMVHAPYLQPFEDVNKRVSRLSANIPLIRENLCPLSFIDVPERAYVDGILGVYELNRIELLRDVFVWAYQRSCARYSAVSQSIGEPDPFRLRYRNEVAQTVREIIQNRIDKKKATGFIKQCADINIPAADHGRFIEVVETEVMGLHEGNIARYRLRPSEYQAWREVW